MKRISWIMMAVILLSASGAWAGEIRHKVVRGDCLSKLRLKYGVSEKEIQKRNRLGDSTIILRGHYLWIPEKATRQTKVRSTKKNVAKIATPRKHKKAVLSGVSEYNLEDSGADKYTGSPEEGVWLLGRIDENEISSTKVVMLKESPFVNEDQIIKKGQHFRMTSGRNKVGEYIAGWDFFVRRAEFYVNGVYGGIIYVRTSCGNYIDQEVSLPSPPAKEKEPPVVIIRKPEPTPKTTSIFVSEEEERSILTEHELGGGIGPWQNDEHSSKGLWWFAEYKAHLRNLENDFVGGTIRPAVGIFARGDIGKVR
ncbi:MAG: hypothetical protein EOM84_01520 [Sphingobacteriia bacterium]|nr:hypothetical protein [Sphingobacteriia bacterium]